MTDPHTWSVAVPVAQLCARVPGGTGRYTTGLVRALATSAPLGARVVGISAWRECGALDDLPISVRRVRVPGTLMALLWERGVPPRPAREGVVHAPTLLVPPASRRYRLVVTVHDVVPWSHPETLTPRGVAFHQRMGRRTARQADLIVTPTNAVAAQVREALDPQCPVEVYPPGGSPLVLGTAPSQYRRALGATGDYVLFVGTAEPRKGLDVLVRAMALPECGGLRLVVAGPWGWGDVDIGDLADRAGVRDRVIVTGWTTDQQLAALYQGASVVAMPSRAEGFGLPLLEGMGAGVPVVTSSDAALMEVGGGATLVVPVDDVEQLGAALARPVADIDLRRDLIDRGRKRAAAFSWSRTAERLWERYAALRDEQ